LSKELRAHGWRQAELLVENTMTELREGDTVKVTVVLLMDAEVSVEYRKTEKGYEII
jgi:hypothetical protein